jgi:hypothetical protein
MEEPGELCTVVFALIGTEPASECMCGGRSGSRPSPLPKANSVKFNTLFRVKYPKCLTK